MEVLAPCAAAVDPVEGAEPTFGAVIFWQIVSHGSAELINIYN